jgi:putative addiction module component (TIGR02574 family)
MSKELLEQVRKLPINERVELCEEILASLAADGFMAEVDDEEAATIEGRWQEHLANPNDVVPWETVKAEVEERFGTAL